MTSKPSEPLDQAEALYALGQLAFERGNYRDAIVAFEKSLPFAGAGTLLGGAIQLWLMNAYSAANRQSDAVAVGQKLAQHPDRDVRKESKRLLEILQAPRLQRRADWLTPIPDLSELDGNETTPNFTRYTPVKKKRTAIAASEPEPEDLSQMNTRDNGFLWVALVLIALLLGGGILLS